MGSDFVLPGARHFGSFSATRANLRAVLDAAQAGRVTTVIREAVQYVVVPADQFREDLTALRPSGAVVSAEGGGWSVVLPGLPVHGDGETFDLALQDAVAALREYAEDWNQRLRTAPNHRQHRPVVELIELSTDEQLVDWLVGRTTE
jgi:hypothetical protein